MTETNEVKKVLLFKYTIRMQDRSPVARQVPVRKPRTDTPYGHPYDGDYIGDYYRRQQEQDMFRVDPMEEQRYYLGDPPMSSRPYVGDPLMRTSETLCRTSETAMSSGASNTLPYYIPAVIKNYGYPSDPDVQEYKTIREDRTGEFEWVENLYKPNEMNRADYYRETSQWILSKFPMKSGKVTRFQIWNGRFKALELKIVRGFNHERPIAAGFERFFKTMTEKLLAYEANELEIDNYVIDPENGEWI